MNGYVFGRLIENTLGDPLSHLLLQPLELRNYRDTLKYDLVHMRRFYDNMLARDVCFMMRGNFFISAAHTE